MSEPIASVTITRAWEADLLGIRDAEHGAEIPAVAPNTLVTGLPYALVARLRPVKNLGSDNIRFPEHLGKKPQPPVTIEVVLWLREEDWAARQESLFQGPFQAPSQQLLIGDANFAIRIPCPTSTIQLRITSTVANRSGTTQLVVDVAGDPPPSVKGKFRT